MGNIGESLIISYDKSDKDETVLVVSKRNNSNKLIIVNVIIGKEAETLHDKLIKPIDDTVENLTGPLNNSVEEILEGIKRSGKILKTLGINLQK